MALQLGTENKRQVYILARAAGVHRLASADAVVQSFAGPSTPPPPAASSPAGATPAANARPKLVRRAPPPQDPAKTREKLTNTGLDPTLHLDKLAQSE